MGLCERVCFLKFVRMERVFRRTGRERGVSPRWGCLTDLLGTVTKCRIVAYHVNIVPRRTRGASGLRDDGTVDDDGATVGSKALHVESGMSVSPATIRNVMSDLEDRGFLSSPHTSAGRIPTSQGYRVFVDSLLQMSPIEENAIQAL